MAEFTMKIAGAAARVRCLFDSTPQYFHAYLTAESPRFSVTVRRSDLLFEQEQLDLEAREEGFRRRQFTDPFLERAAIQRAFAEYLFAQDVLLVHGSAVAVDGEGYLFVARSGTGKSTHTRLWREKFGDRATMINDDKPFLALSSAGVTAYGSPWSGKHGLDSNIAVPLKGICILERGAENRVFPITPQQALPMLCKQTYQPLDENKASACLQLTKILATSVPLWGMTCTPTPEAAAMAYDTMNENNGGMNHGKKSE